MNDPLVSVIIPTFNNAPYIAEALESVFRNCLCSCQVIVVDDGSTDNTKRIIMPYQDRLTYLHQENRGASAARNSGLVRAKGEFIAFMDGDDVWFEGNLVMKLGYLLNNPGVGAIFSNFRTFDRLGIIEEDGMRSIYPIFRKKGGRLEEIFREKSPLSYNGLGCFVYKGNIFESILFGNLIATCSIMIRRECIDYTGFFREDLRTQEDYDYWLRLSRGCDMACIDVPLVGYRRHSRQLTKSRMDYLILDVARVLEPYRRDIGLLSKPTAQQFRKRYSELMNLLGIAYLKSGNRKDAARAFRRGFYMDLGNLPSLAFWLSTPFWRKPAVYFAFRVAKRIKNIQTPAILRSGGAAADRRARTDQTDQTDKTGENAGQEKISVQGT